MQDGRGPNKYTGRPLKVAHANLDITEADWALAGEELVKVLQRHGVGATEQEELLTRIQAVKSDIVTKP